MITTSTSSTGSMSDVTSQIGQQMDELSNQISNTTQNGDMNDPATLMQVQQETEEWSMMVTMESNIIKAIGDALKAIAQNTGN